MNIEMQPQHSCCCHTSEKTNNTNTASPAESSESFSVVFSSATITSYFNPWTGESLKPEQTQHTPTEPTGLQAILQNLPNVRRYLKPWYFPEAQNHNISYIRTVAIRIVSTQSENHSSETLETVFDALKQQNNVTETHHCCKKSEGVQQAAQNTSEDILSNTDKIELEKLHHYAKGHHLNPDHVNTIATKLAIDKTSAAKNQEDLPSLSKKYFEDELKDLNVWKNNIHGQQVVNHLKAYFSS